MSTVEIDITIVKETDLAVLVDTGDPEFYWIPGSLIKGDSEFKEGQTYTIELPIWFATQEGLV